MSKQKIVLVIAVCIGLMLVPYVACAETDIDLRIKLGSAAGVDKFEIGNVETDTSSQGSSNFQIEVAFSPRSDSTANFVGTVGLFGRHHEGQFSDLGAPTDVEYDAGGLSGSAGVGIKANETLHFEGRLELALGTGKPTLTTPGFVWHETRAGGYSAVSLILGGYATISKPGLQLGLELGAQSFTGNFQIWNSISGNWDDGKVKGSGGTINLVVGYRF